ncbi:hypothetical protein Tco_1038800, partial [Tanacetum coccineum]
GDEIDVEDDDSFTFVIRTFLPFLTYPADFPYFPPPKMRTPFLTPTSPLRAGGFSSGWNFHVLKCYPNINESQIEIFSSIYTLSKDE